jgi:hypothetical protein
MLSRTRLTCDAGRRNMRLLDEAAFRHTCTAKMRQLGPTDEPPFDFWPYVAAIPKEDYQGFDCSAARVPWVWRSEDDAFEHVLIDTKEDPDVFMVIVLDRAKSEVAGHRLLDLKREYGWRA